MVSVFLELFFIVVFESTENIILIFFENYFCCLNLMLRYLRGTMGKALCFKSGDTILTGC